jgi:hypothetical protein
VSRPLAALAGLVSFGLLAAILAVLATGGPGVAGSTGVPPDAFVVELLPGQAACQASAPLPPEGGLAQVVVGVEDGSRARLAFSARRGGDVVSRGVAVAPPGVVEIPIRRATRERADRVCIRNAGRSPVALAGRSGGEVRLSGRRDPQPATLSVLYVRPDPPSWLSQAGTIAGRFAHVRLAPLGTAMLWFGLAFALLAWVGAVITTVYSQRD